MKTFTDYSLIIGAAILGVAALWHFYWAFGGGTGKARAVPQNQDGTAVFEPSAAATAFVGTAIAFLAALYLTEGLNGLEWPAVGQVRATLVTYAVMLAGLVFAARAIGDIKYVGFFKHRKGTAFADADTCYYSPLCLFLGVAGLMTAATRFL